MSNSVSVAAAPPSHVTKRQSHSDEAAELQSSTSRLDLAIAILALVGITVNLFFRFATNAPRPYWDAPLLVVLGVGGTYVLAQLLKKLLKFEFGADLLAGVTIITALVLGEYLAGAIIVLMFTGGQALESYAVRNASSVLRALADRMPSIAHVSSSTGVKDVPISEIRVNDQLVILPHEICPTDGIVTEGRGVMDESYLTGEPFEITKTAGSEVLSGAVNGDSVLHIRALRPPGDSRYAKIAMVMQEAQQHRPRMRRLADSLGSFYTPVALLLAVAAAAITGDPTRFLAVVVIATPCPLLLGIPVAIIGAVSMCARRAIIIRDPAVLEEACRCETVIFDKTGTLTYGRPQLTEQLVASAFSPPTVLRLVASLEQYSRHPLAVAVLHSAKSAGLPTLEAAEISEAPGEGLRGKVLGRSVVVTSRSRLASEVDALPVDLPPTGSGLECIIVIDRVYAATYRFHDEPKADGKSFVWHLAPKHNVRKLLLVSGDREEEVKYLGNEFHITSMFAGQSPEQKLEIVKRETQLGRTLYIGDGINDAPALLTATVGIAMGANSDVTTNAAGAVVLENALSRVDELLHISKRMRTIALQSAVGGMAVSVVGMLVAAAGFITPVAGAILQEVIDAAAVLNALRTARAPSQMTDYESAL